MNDFSALGLLVSMSTQVLHIRSEIPLTVLSSAVVGGGYCRAQDIINMHVKKNYDCGDPASDLRAVACRLGINEPFIGLMTAVNLDKARSTMLQQNETMVGAIITAGISNATCAGVTLPFLYMPCTINIMAFLNVELSHAAMVNAAITITEAKCATLSELGVRTTEGHPATGTSTDTVTIASTCKGPIHAYAGPVTVPGWLLARAVRQALTEALTPSS